MWFRKFAEAWRTNPRATGVAAAALCIALTAIVLTVRIPQREHFELRKPIASTVDPARKPAAGKPPLAKPSAQTATVKRQPARHVHRKVVTKAGKPISPREAVVVRAPQPKTPDTPEPRAVHPESELPLTPVNPDLASFHPTPALLVHGPQNLPKVALTFDAGSDAKAVPMILKTLEAHHVHATFFQTGRICEKFPAECRAIAEAGMELGNHSYQHPYFTRLSDAMVREELERAEEAIVKACGRGAKPLFRFPYGDSNARTQRTVAAAGYQPIHWTLDSLDAFRKAKTADFVAGRIDSRVKPGFITLMHVSCVTSAEALPRIFDQLDKMGAQVVPVSELLLAGPVPGAHDAKTHVAGLKETIAQ